jgi:hypothetical protein
MENKIKMLILAIKNGCFVGATMSHVKSQFELCGILDFIGSLKFLLACDMVTPTEDKLIKIHGKFIHLCKVVLV